MATIMWNDALREAQLLVSELNAEHGADAFDSARARLNAALSARRTAEADLLAAACLVLIEEGRRRDAG